MRIYLYQPASIPEVVKRWSEAIPERIKLSPLAACWSSEVGGLNKFVHVWAYKDFAERDHIRTEAFKQPTWPPKTREFLVSQTTKILLPAVVFTNAVNGAFSLSRKAGEGRGEGYPLVEKETFL